MDGGDAKKYAKSMGFEIVGLFRVGSEGASKSGREIYEENPDCIDIMKLSDGDVVLFKKMPQASKKQ